MKTLAMTAILILAAASRAHADEADASGHFSGCPAQMASTGPAALSQLLADPEVSSLARPKIGCEERTAKGAAILASKKTLDVPADIQDGPTCGFQVLRSLMRYWNREARGGAIVPGMSVGYDPIYDVSRSLNVAFGGWANAYALTRIAAHYGFTAGSMDALDPEHRSVPQIADLRHEVELGRPVAAAICVDEHGCPVRKKNALGGHWCVIEGFIRGDDGKEYVVAKHPWRAESFLWSVDDFEASWTDQGRQCVRILPTAETSVLGTMQRGFDANNRHD